MRPLPAVALLPLLLALGACQAASAPAAAPRGDDGTGPAGLDAPTPALRAIGEVQGAGSRSPFVDQLVTVRGVVVGNFATGLDGVFVQSEQDDGDPASSNALFVSRGPNDEPKLRTGDRIEASGRVVELGEGAATLTALRENVVKVVAPGQLPAPVELREPLADWEAYEGMRVRIAAPLVVIDNGGVASYGEIEAAFGARLWQPTEAAAPGPDAKRVDADNARRRLLVDDARLQKDPRNLWFLPQGLVDAQPLRDGSVLVNATGILDQRRGRYRLQLTDKLEVRQVARASARVPSVRGDLRVASFNLHNLFNGDGHGGGFPTERGAQTHAEYERQQAKLVATVQALAPDIATLNEVENDGSGPDSTLAQFVAALNRAGPLRDYRYVDTGDTLGNDSIRVAIIYRQGRATPRGKFATLLDGPFATRSRAPLAQAFQVRGKTLVVAANHFKSKGCGKPPDAATGADADQSDGQACWNAMRVETARRVDAWLKSDPLQVGADAPTLLIGDLNAYGEEDPLRLLRGAGWRDAFARDPKRPRPYSFVFDGQMGRLDHALLNDALARRLRGAEEWHVNADEAEAFDYHAESASGPWRSSDHDPVLLGFDFSAR